LRICCARPALTAAPPAILDESRAGTRLAQRSRMIAPRRVSHRAALLVALAATGCVWNPVDMSTVDSRYTPVDVGGYASVRGTRVQIRGWNFERSEWEPLRVVTASTEGTAPPHPLYAWSTAQLAMGERYWVHERADCRTGGMGRLQVREWNGEAWATLKTFTQGGRECVYEKLAAGQSIVAAGVACYTGDNILMFSNPECVTAATEDTTAPTVLLRATDDEQAWEVTSASAAPVRGSYPIAAPLRLRIDAFDPQGPARVTGTATAMVWCSRSGLEVPVSASFPMSGEQDVSSGAQVERSVGAAVDIDRAALQGVCGGSRMVRASVTVQATGHTVSGVTASTPTATFSAVL
jgi:hypothetical protein